MTPAGTRVLSHCLNLTGRDDAVTQFAHAHNRDRYLGFPSFLLRRWLAFGKRLAAALVELNETCASFCMSTDESILDGAVRAWLPVLAREATVAKARSGVLDTDGQMWLLHYERLHALERAQLLVDSTTTQQVFLRFVICNAHVLIFCRY
jgi:hypothetical protein